MTSKFTGAEIETHARSAGVMAHSEGSACTANGTASHAEGLSCSSSATGAHAEGSSTTASGSGGAHSEGASTTASGPSSHAEGNVTTASGSYAHTQGRGAIADKHGQHAEASFTPATVSAAQAQFSIYKTGMIVPISATADLTFTGDNSWAGTGNGTNVLIIPLKSLILVRFDIIARSTTASSPQNATGACWSGSVLVGRGNSAGTACASSATASPQFNLNPVTVPITYAFDAASVSALSLQYTPNNDNGTYNYLRFAVTNANSTSPYSVVGTLLCTELVTTS